MSRIVGILPNLTFPLATAKRVEKLYARGGDRLELNRVMLFYNRLEGRRLLAAWGWEFINTLTCVSSGSKALMINDLHMVKVLDRDWSMVITFGMKASRAIGIAQCEHIAMPDLTNRTGVCDGLLKIRKRVDDHIRSTETTKG